MTTLARPAPKDHHAGWSVNPRHSGLDYGWGAGDTVTAAADGVVVSGYGAGGYNGGWGNLVIIDHGAGNYTAYAHLASGDHRSVGGSARHARSASGDDGRHRQGVGQAPALRASAGRVGSRLPG